MEDSDDSSSSDCESEGSTIYRTRGPLSVSRLRRSSAVSLLPVVGLVTLLACGLELLGSIGDRRALWAGSRTHRGAQLRSPWKVTPGQGYGFVVLDDAEICEDHIELDFKLPQGPPDPIAFGRELRENLEEMGASEESLDQMEIAIGDSDDGVIATLCGPVPAIDPLRTLALETLQVQGQVATVLGLPVTSTPTPAEEQAAAVVPATTIAPETSTSEARTSTTEATTLEVTTLAETTTTTLVGTSTTLPSPSTSTSEEATSLPTTKEVTTAEPAISTVDSNDLPVPLSTTKAIQESNHSSGENRSTTTKPGSFADEEAAAEKLVPEDFLERLRFAKSCVHRPEELKPKVSKLFQKMDTDGNGCLEHKELDSMIITWAKEFGLSGNTASAEYAVEVQLHTLETPEKVTESDLVKISQAALPKAVRNQLSEILDNEDRIQACTIIILHATEGKEGSGFIDEREFKQLMDVMFEAAGGKTRLNFRKEFDFLDKDHDQKITEEELAPYVSKAVEAFAIWFSGVQPP